MTMHAHTSEPTPDGGLLRTRIHGVNLNPNQPRRVFVKRRSLITLYVLLGFSSAVHLLNFFG